MRLGWAWGARRLSCGTCRGAPVGNLTGLWRCYAGPDNVTANIDDQGQMLSPARDLLSEAKLLDWSYADGGIGRGSLCGSVQSALDVIERAAHDRNCLELNVYFSA